jgi:hypothetical protein
MINGALFFVAGLSWLASVHSQLLFDRPTVLWTDIIDPSSGRFGGVDRGNGVFLTPDDKVLLSTSFGGTVTAYSALGGKLLWEYDPPIRDGASISCHSGIAFADSDTEPYMTYSIVDNENSLVART